MAQFQSLAQEQPIRRGGLILPLLFLINGGFAASWLAKGGAEDFRAVVILIVCTAFALQIFKRVASADVDGAFLYNVLVASWAGKLLAMGFKLWLLENVFGGADAVAYYQAGAANAQILASGAFPHYNQFWSSPSIEIAAGIFFLITGVTFNGAWVAWSLFGTLGALFQYRGFVIALPHANRRLFMLLVFFMPSILMWTNSLGKDAMMAFFIGMTAYGAARLHAGGLRLGSLFWTGVGVAGTMIVRPHLAGILAVALFGVFMLRPIRAGMLTPLIRLATLAAFAVLAVIVVRTAASFINLEDLSLEGVQGFLEEEGSQSGGGGSEFEGSLPTSPQGIVIGMVTVLFRPFPWETGSMLAMATSLESVALAALMLWRLRRVLGAIWEARRHGYLAFVTIYALLFMFFFSIISNFGILVRQRVQLLPFIFVWIAFERLRANQEGAEVG